MRRPAGDYMLFLINDNGVPSVAEYVRAGFGLPGDFDFSGVVDGMDLLLWQQDPGVGSLADWEANYGSPLSASSAVVPEPSTMVIVLAALAALKTFPGRGRR